MRWNDCKAGAIGLSLLAGSLVASNAEAARLFGTGAGVDEFFELDPATGAVLRTINGPPSSPRDGLAFDGESLWHIGSTPNLLSRLDPETGQTLETFALPADPTTSPEDPTGNSEIRSGLAFLNGLIYISQWDRPVQDIEVFDPAVGEVVRTLDIDGMNPDARQFANSGLAAITGPDRLIVSTGLTQELFFIDPETGIITDTIHHNQFGVFGIAVAEGEIYLGSSQLGSPDDGVEAIHVYTRDVVEVRNFNLPNTTNIYSLAGDHTAIPEPGTAALLACAGAALLRRRQR